MGRPVLADVSENSLRKPRMLALDVPRVASRPRVQQAQRISGHDTVDMDVLLAEWQRPIVPLEIAGAITADAMPENQILRARRRADRVQLHKSERPYRAFEVARSEERARNRILTEAHERNAVTRFFIPCEGRRQS
jgi:hypothetical protein